MLAGFSRRLTKTFEVLGVFQRSSIKVRGQSTSWYDFRGLSRILEDIAEIGGLRTYHSLAGCVQGLKGLSRISDVLGGFSGMLEVLVEFQRSFKNLSRISDIFSGILDVSVGFQMSQQDFRCLPSILGVGRIFAVLVGFSRIIEVFACFQRS